MKKKILLTSLIFGALALGGAAAAGTAVAITNNNTTQLVNDNSTSTQSSTTIENSSVKITRQSTTVRLYNNDEATLFVSASRKNSLEGELIYAWYRLSSDGSSWIKVQVGTNNKYVIAGSDYLNSNSSNTINQQWKCEVYTRYNSSNYVTSDVMNVIIIPKTSSSTALVVKDLDSSIDIEGGKEGTLSFVASSTTSTINYQWYISFDGGKTFTTKGNESVITTNSNNRATISLTLDSSLTKEYSGKTIQLYCKFGVGNSGKFTNSTTTAKTSISEIVKDVITVSGSDQVLEVNAGQEVTLSVNATSKLGATLMYTWYEGEDSNNWGSPLQSSTSNTFIVTADKTKSISSKSIFFTVIITSSADYVESDAQVIFELDVRDNSETIPDTITINESATDVYVNPGNTAILSVTATSELNQKLSYEWYKGKDTGYGWEANSVGSSNIYTVPESITSSNAGKTIPYTVIVSSAFGTTQSKTIYVHVNSTNTNNDETDVNTTVNATLTVPGSRTVLYNVSSNTFAMPTYALPEYLVTVDTEGDYTYQWYYVDSFGLEHAIDDATKSTFIPTVSLVSKINGTVDILAKVYKNGSLVAVATNYASTLTVIQK